MVLFDEELSKDLFTCIICNHVCVPVPPLTDSTYSARSDKCRHPEMRNTVSSHSYEVKCNLLIFVIIGHRAASTLCNGSPVDELVL